MSVCARASLLTFSEYLHMLNAKRLLISFSASTNIKFIELVVFSLFLPRLVSHSLFLSITNKYSPLITIFQSLKTGSYLRTREWCKHTVNVMEMNHFTLPTASGSDSQFPRHSDRSIYIPGVLMNQVLKRQNSTERRSYEVIENCFCCSFVIAGVRVIAPHYLNMGERA